jgi:hypothetical protein
MNAIDQIRNDATGLKILHEWLGDGGNPVSHSQATWRGENCVDCPFNCKESYMGIFKQGAAAAIKQHLEVKHSSDLTTMFDDDLHLCTACSCILPLKVWVPFAVIRAHTSDKSFDKLPRRCWQIKELDGHAPKF